MEHRREERDTLRQKLIAMDTADDNMEGLDQFMGVLCVNLLVIAMRLSDILLKKSHEKNHHSRIKLFDPAVVVVPLTQHPNVQTYL
jgi:hypothetical protein